MPDPLLCWSVASVPKPGHRADENEDAAAGDPAAMRFAVADGASEGWQSGRWAARLAAAFVRRPPTPADFPRWLAAVRKSWKPPAPDGPVPWYAEQKREQGAFAALVGVEFRLSKRTPGLAWKAVAIGDSCLVVLRGGRVELSFPVSAGDRFGNAPPLVPSAAAVRCPRPEWLAGRAEPGDVFLLATDTAAAAVLRAAAAPAGLPASPDPAALLESLSALQSLLHDDLTLAVIRSPESRP
jgi:hypothetical protein